MARCCAEKRRPLLAIYRDVPSLGTVLVYEKLLMTMIQVLGELLIVGSLHVAILNTERRVSLLAMVPMKQNAARPMLSA